MARPSKYTDEVVTRICDALRAGNTRRAACAYGCISQDSLAVWLKTKPHFADAIKKAEGDAEVTNLAIIQKAAHDGTWQAAAWWLERKLKADWSTRIETTGADGSPVRVVVEYVKDVDARD
jgi:hypothetical protein